MGINQPKSQSVPPAGPGNDGQDVPIVRILEGKFRTAGGIQVLLGELFEMTPSQFIAINKKKAYPPDAAFL